MARQPRRPTRRRRASTARYRSNFEAQVANAAEREGIELVYEPAHRRLAWIPKPRKYLPDFEIKTNGVLVETKGRLTYDDRMKLLAVIRDNPEIDLRLVFQRDQPIRKGSPTLYSEWAEKHGIVYAIGRIPKEWSTQ